MYILHRIGVWIIKEIYADETLYSYLAQSLRTHARNPLGKHSQSSILSDNIMLMS